MTSTFGTNSAGTNEWLAATKGMQWSTAEPVFSQSGITVVKSDDFTQQELEQPRQTSQSAAKTK
ncbi:MAG: hypothetical protein ACLQMO_06400 [Acidobacteriaceae bacterium]